MKSASGMGRATAQVFAAEGANVAVTDLPGPALEQVAADLAAQGYNAKAWPLDVSDHAAIRQVVDDVAATFGGLDAVVNSAGISAFGGRYSMRANAALQSKTISSRTLLEIKA